MTNRRLILTAGTCAGLLIAGVSLAVPVKVSVPHLQSAISLVDDDESDRDDDRHELRRHHDHHDRHGAREHDDDDDDDRDGAMQPQNDTAPANGLFTPGAKPKVQVN